MNRHLILLSLAQGMFLTNNVTFIAINVLVGLSLATLCLMATLTVICFLVGCALSSSFVAKTQKHFFRNG